MGFDFEAFAGALVTLSKAFDKTAERTGIPREALTAALSRYAANRGKKEDAQLWKSARSSDELGKWIYRQARTFNCINEEEILQLADEIPGRIRRNLMEVVKSIPAAHGGKRPALDFIKRWQARAQVKELHDNGLSRDNAYQKVAKRMHVSAHTVRRTCDKKERERSRQANRKLHSAFADGL